MNRREFLMTTLAAFALSALPKLTLADKRKPLKVRLTLKISSVLGLCVCRLRIRPIKHPLIMIL